jgi:predicted metal-binding membrane protein
VPARTSVAASNRAALLALIGCTLLAWYFTVASLVGMPAGQRSMGASLAGFLAAWTLMMAAMMLPALAPLTSMYLRSIRAVPSSAVRASRTMALLSGYLATWIGFGVFAYVASVFCAMLAADAPDLAPWVGAGLVLVAGVYQLTPLKDFCLRHCRSPMAFLLHVSAYKGRFRDVRVGLYHGLYCIGCCWGLMVVLVAVGVMNLAWMAVLAATILLEKTWKQGRTFSRLGGAALIVFAFFVPANPWLLPVIYFDTSF